jgi:ceramide glucosyltransferase
VRWARLRRATFAPYYAPELLTSSLYTLVAAAIAAPELGLDAPLAVILAALVWYGAEAALALLAGWPLGWASAPSWIARDLALPLLWIQGWSRDRFVWRGNVMSVDDDALATDTPGPFPPA